MKTALRQVSRSGATQWPRIITAQRPRVVLRQEVMRGGASRAGREAWRGAPRLSPRSPREAQRRGSAGSGSTTSITSGIYVCKRASDASCTHDPGHDNYGVHGSTEAPLMMGVIAIILRQTRAPAAGLSRWCLP